MSNQPMTCDGVADQLASYLEGELLEPMRLEVEAHAADCTACGALLADLDTIRSEASALPVLEPSRDLWSGISARIDAPVVALEESRRTRMATIRRTWVRPSLAAAALVLVTAGVTHYFTRASFDAAGDHPVGKPALIAQAGSAPSAGEPNSRSEPSSRDSSTPSAEPVGGSMSSPRTDGSSSGVRSGARSASAAARLASAVPAMMETQPVYDQEIGKLRAIVKERRSQLDPKTIAVLEQSIAVIDSAIAQSRAALAKDPSSGFLATQLNHSLDKKVELLRTAALLPSRT